MSEDEGRGPAGEGGDGSPGEKIREVPPGVVSTQGVMSALKAAAEKFREYEASHNAQAQEANGRALNFDSAPGAVLGQSSHHVEAAARQAKAAANRQMAEMCEGAIADLEKALTEAHEAIMNRPRAPAPPSPAALFKAGFEYGMRAYAWGLANEEERPRPKVQDFAPPPPADCDAAWALVRAQLASAR